jgi:phosphonate transport system substrate-binding protein
MMLVDAGADCGVADLTHCPPLDDVVFTGGHDAAAQTVINGSADAAGLELRILHRLESEGVVDSGSLRVIESRLVMGYPWVAREGLSEEAREVITDAFTAISEDELLDLMRADGYVAVAEADYEEIRDSSLELGLLTVSE